MHRLLIIIFLIVVAVGCTSNTTGRKNTTKLFEHMYPTKVEWDNPEMTLKSFFGAKKTGDWKKAYEICDFSEVLPRDEAWEIRDAWEKDSVNWVDRYMFHDWYVAEKIREGDTATLVVTEMYNTPDTESGIAQANYNEIMKLYGKKWKLVAALKSDEPEEKEKSDGNSDQLIERSPAKSGTHGPIPTH